MKAALILRQMRRIEDDLWAEIVVWEVPHPVRGSHHSYKYRLALIDRGQCVLRYDNEAGKGDHMHIDETEVVYRFEGIAKLFDDFKKDSDRYQKRRFSR